MRFARFMIALVIFALSATLAVAQELPQGDGRNAQFRLHMNKIVTANSDISDFQKMDVGREYKLPDGAHDNLADGDTKGIWGREFSKWYGISYGEFLDGKKPIATPPPTPPIIVEKPVNDTQDKVVTASAWYKSPWFWIPLLFLLGLLEYIMVKRWLNLRELNKAEAREREEDVARAAERERELTQNPVTSGPPIVSGGILPTETDRLENHFQDWAIAEYIRANPGTDAATVRLNIVRVSDIEEGMIAGEGNVGYTDMPRPRRINPPEPGYRARFRFPDGSEPELMSLQKCMNPCYYGEGLSGFTFTPRSVVVPLPVPQAPAPQPVPHPALAVARVRAAADSEGRSTVTIGDRVITFDRGAHFMVDEETGAINLTGSSFDMTIKPKRKATTVQKRKTATGTGN